jgi:HlyD family secretion protein
MERDLKSLKIDPARRQGAEYRPGRKGLWLIVLIVIVVGAAAFVVFSGRFGESSAGKPEAAAAQGPSSPAPPAAETSGDTLKASGYIVAHHKIAVGSKVMGKVAWIGVEKGDKVRKGQLLVKLDDREYVAQVQQAEAAERAAEARLAELKAGNRPEEIQRAAAELARYRADSANADVELKRLESLLKSGAVAQQDVDNAKSRAEMAAAAVGVAERNYELMKLGPRAEEIASAKAEVDRARASVEYASVLLDATRITAPINGTVLERLVETGEMVTTSFAGETGAKSSVVALADLNDLQVELDISQADFNRVSSEQDCVMSPEAYPERKYRCRIAEIAPEADRQKATIQVKVQVLEPDSYLRPEMTADVTFSNKKTAQDQPAGKGSAPSN